MDFRFIEFYQFIRKRVLAVHKEHQTNNFRAIKQCRIFLICMLVFGILSASCGAIKKEDKPTYEERTNRNGGDDLISVKEDDPEMTKAIEMARNTLNEFDEALEKKDPKAFDFHLKVIFNEEHLWIGDNWKKDGTYYGILYNDPLDEKNMNMKFGDTIKIDSKNITDWQYCYTTKSSEYYNDTIYGSYTTRVLRNKMSKKERDDFDEQTFFMYK